jgi:hypothetical protein
LSRTSGEAAECGNSTGRYNLRWRLQVNPAAAKTDGVYRSAN